MRKLILLLLLVLFVSCTPAVQPSPTPNQAGTGLVIGYAAPELTGGQGVIMAGLTTYAQAEKWQVETASANSDATTQASQIDFFIGKKVSAIVAVPVDSQGICASAEKARAAGIPFYTIDRAPIGCKINMTVLADNYLAGVQAGEEMVRLLTERHGKPQGTVLELQGDLRQNVAILRGDGFNSILKKYPEIKVIQRQTQWQPKAFADEAEAVLKAEASLDGIYFHSDCIGVPNVLPVMDKLGKKIKRGEPGHIFIAGVDGCGDALQAIRDGYVDQSSSQPLTDFGIVTRWIRREVNGEGISAGQVTEDGAPWSPATVRDSETGWQLLLATTSVTPANVSAPNLWGNRK